MQLIDYLLSGNHMKLKRICLFKLSARLSMKAFNSVQRESVFDLGLGGGPEGIVRI